MTALSKKAKYQITAQIENVVNKYISKAENKPRANSANPFVMALLKDFEPLIHRIHGMKTSLGSEMEKIAEIIAVESWGSENVRRNFKMKVELPSNVFQAIDVIVNDLSNSKTLSHYETEKKKILNSIDHPSEKMLSHTYEFDLELKDEVKKEIFCLEMKGPDPNTTEVPGAKRRLLTSLALNAITYPNFNTDCMLAIYYNNKFPRIYKNPKVFSCFSPERGIIVHDSFWNFLGKNPNTFNELVNLFEEFGLKNKKRIWNGFSKLIKL